MALSTAADYKTALYKILHVLPRDLDPETWIRDGGVARADAYQIMSEYDAWRHTLGSRINQPHIRTAHS